MKLERNQFIQTISVYFGIMSIFQFPTLYYYDFFNFWGPKISPKKQNYNIELKQIQRSGAFRNSRITLGAFVI